MASFDSELGEKTVKFKCHSVAGQSRGCDIAAITIVRASASCLNQECERLSEKPGSLDFFNINHFCLRAYWFFHSCWSFDTTRFEILNWDPERACFGHAPASVDVDTGSIYSCLSLEGLMIGWLWILLCSYVQFRAALGVVLPKSWTKRKKLEATNSALHF